ncbi:uncharacterized protein G2W53_043360 [Senna tora]|uniref:Uncharacterized protein n=1 Tax=Senna tora TaxID=362788 RepID=A0A834SIL3_9FABA|nr:uncharacterized protein G2W53_043360 [Senna tora]
MKQHYLFEFCLRHKADIPHSMVLIQDITDQHDFGHISEDIDIKEPTSSIGMSAFCSSSLMKSIYRSTSVEYSDQVNTVLMEFISIKRYWRKPVMRMDEEF